LSDNGTAETVKNSFSRGLLLKFTCSLFSHFLVEKVENMPKREANFDQNGDKKHSKSRSEFGAYSWLLLAPFWLPKCTPK